MKIVSKGRTISYKYFLDFEEIADLDPPSIDLDPPTELGENIILNVLVEINNTFRFNAY